MIHTEARRSLEIFFAVTPGQGEHSLGGADGVVRAFLQQPLNEGMGSRADGVGSLEEALMDSVAALRLGQVIGFGPVYPPRNDGMPGKPFSVQGIEQVHEAPADMNNDLPTHPGVRRRVKGSPDGDMAVRMHFAQGDFEQREAVDGKRLERRLLLGLEELVYLPFDRAVDAGVGPTLSPVVQEALLVLETFEGPALEGILDVLNLRLDLALVPGSRHPAGTGDDVVVGQQSRIERIELGIVEIGLYHSLLEIIQADDFRDSAEVAEGLFMQLTPDTAGRLPDDFSEGLSAVGEF